MKNETSKAVGIWLLTGLVMVFLQIMIGGITRLTGSGLSITEWQPILGAIPPMNAAEWQVAFQKYQQIDQFKLVNSQMSLEEFKGIYFWEYFHRLWARAMGFVFLLPIIYFWWTKKISTAQLPKYGMLMILGGLAGLMGWIMVASGLEEDMVLVNPVKLMGHLLIACSIFMYLARLIAEFYYPKERRAFDKNARRLIAVFMLLIVVQIGFGGLVAGAKAALNCNTWPLMNGALIPSGLGIFTPFSDHVPENNITLQFIHRMMAYGIFFFGMYLFFSLRKTMAQPEFHRYRIIMALALFTQLLLGIITVIYSQGKVPVFWGVTHQLMAFMLLIVTVAMHYFVKYRAISRSSIR